VRRIGKLTARAIAALKRPGRHSDGGNLYLSISPTSGGLSKRWTFLYVFRGKQRELGLGSTATVSLAGARARAADCRRTLAMGIDPLDARKAASHARTTPVTFGEVAVQFHKSRRSKWRSGVHAEQVIDTLKRCKSIWNFPVALLDTAAILGVLQPIWQKTPETASRLRARIERVLDAARASGHIPPNEANPARWRGHLDCLLAKRSALSIRHHEAMSHADVPGLIRRLRLDGSVQSFALEFAILAACRTGEVLGMTWSELQPDLWIIPATRMKSGRLHRIPLSSRAQEIVEKMASIRSSSLVFPGHARNRALGHSSLLALVKRHGSGTVHGLRSSFRDWCADVAHAPREIAEQCLAHVTGSQTEQAYNRTDLLERRRAIMEAWCSYVEPGEVASVLPLRG
jgi:integrase